MAQGIGGGSAAQSRDTGQGHDNKGHGNEGHGNGDRSGDQAQDHGRGDENGGRGNGRGQQGAEDSNGQGGNAGGQSGESGAGRGNTGSDSGQPGGGQPEDGNPGGPGGPGSGDPAPSDPAPSDPAPGDPAPEDTPPNPPADRTLPADDAGSVRDPRPDEEVGLIEAPVSVTTAVPDGAFALAPERVSPSGTPRLRTGPAGSPPVVVELFTAQGCSSCPPADALIAALADQAEVLPLSWHVDYWDYLGWTDDFASPVNTARQEGYAAVAGERSVYTPQIIVDGQDTLIGVSRAGLLALIDDHAARPPAIMVTASVQGADHVIDLTPRAAIPGGVQVVLVRYLPRRDVRVAAGENRGRVLGYRNIVVGIETLSRWPARSPLRLTVRPGSEATAGYPADTRHAILVQQNLPGDRPGPILAGMRLD